ncbi:hypothetical protein ACH5RR_030926 [Cinchona calisaya]|uniref:Uncharacterized protein n=1 Tax=Cinchona calisaya TaxID=153742 RepID=A0ABD2YDQ1_9GENT
MMGIMIPSAAHFLVISGKNDIHLLCLEMALKLHALQPEAWSTKAIDDTNIHFFVLFMMIIVFFFPLISKYIFMHKTWSLVYQKYALTNEVQILCSCKSCSYS